MKKLMIAMMAVVMILTGCGKKEPVPEETTVPPTIEAAIVETTVETTVPETEPTIVVTEPAVTEEATEPPTEAPTEGPTEPAGEVGIVVNAKKLNVRKEPSVNADKIAQLDGGTQVVIYETTETAGMTWGRIDLGWVSMDYIRLGEASAPQQKPAENEFHSEEHNSNKVDEQEHKDTEQDQQNNDMPHSNHVPEIPVEENKAPQSNIPAVPQNNEKESNSPARESVVPEPTQHQHTWTPIQNIPAEYVQHGYVVCSCGARFNDTTEWTAHRDTYLGSEDLGNHTGYSSGTDQVEVTPAQVMWQCSDCGSTKTLGAWDNP